VRIESKTTDTRIHYVLVCDCKEMDRVLGAEWFVPSQEYLVPDARGHFNTADEVVLAQARKAFTEMPPRYLKVEEVLKLTSVIHKTWMNRLTIQGRIQHFDCLSDYIAAYAEIRLIAYQERIDYHCAELERQALVLENKVRFVDEITSGSLDWKVYADKSKYWSDLERRGYVSENDPCMKKKPVRILSDLPVCVHEEGAKAVDEDSVSFSYLTRLSSEDFLEDAIRSQKRALEAVRRSILTARELTPRQTWRKELVEFHEAYSIFAAKRADANHVDIPSKTEVKKLATKRRKTKA